MSRDPSLSVVTGYQSIQSMVARPIAGAVARQSLFWAVNFQGNHRRGVNSDAAGCSRTRHIPGPYFLSIPGPCHSAIPAPVPGPHLPLRTSRTRPDAASSRSVPASYPYQAHIFLSIPGPYPAHVCVCSERSIERQTQRCKKPRILELRSPSSRKKKTSGLKQ